MDRNIVPVEPCAALDLKNLAERAHNFAQEAKSGNTRRAYKADWADFTTWCNSAERSSLPAEPATIALYITGLSERAKAATIKRRLVAISQAHQLAGISSPTGHVAVREVLKGILRQHGSAPTQKNAVGTAELRALLQQTPNTLIGVRDRAMLLLGFAAALRRSELVALDMADITFVQEQGLVIKIRRSKTDAEGRGREIAVPYARTANTCPVLSLRSWIDKSGLNSGPIFRPVTKKGTRSVRLSDRAVARIVQRYAKSAGLDETRYGGHSLRAGYVTAAAAVGAAESDIQEVTGHKSVQILREYVRHGTLFHRCPLSAMDL